jgi:hypothetical protein
MIGSPSIGTNYGMFMDTTPRAYLASDPTPQYLDIMNKMWAGMNEYLIKMQELLHEWAWKPNTTNLAGGLTPPWGDSAIGGGDSDAGGARTPDAVDAARESHGPAAVAEAEAPQPDAATTGGPKDTTALFAAAAPEPKLTGQLNDLAAKHWGGSKPEGLQLEVREYNGCRILKISYEPKENGAALDPKDQKLVEFVKTLNRNGKNDNAIIIGDQCFGGKSNMFGSAITVRPFAELTPEVYVQLMKEAAGGGAPSAAGSVADRTPGPVEVKKHTLFDEGEKDKNLEAGVMAEFNKYWKKNGPRPDGLTIEVRNFKGNPIIKVSYNGTSLDANDSKLQGFVKFLREKILSYDGAVVIVGDKEFSRVKKMHGISLEPAKNLTPETYVALMEKAAGGGAPAKVAETVDAAKPAADTGGGESLVALRTFNERYGENSASPLKFKVTVDDKNPNLVSLTPIKVSGGITEITKAQLEAILADLKSLAKQPGMTVNFPDNGGIELNAAKASTVIYGYVKALALSAGLNVKEDA